MMNRAINNNEALTCQSCKHCVLCKAKGSYVCTKHDILRSTEMPICDQFEKGSENIFDKGCQCERCKKIELNIRLWADSVCEALEGGANV